MSSSSNEPVLSLPVHSRAVIIGQYPDPLTELTCLRDAYHDPSNAPVRFKQVITLRSENLVQMNNFMRRCRTERQRGMRNEYLVFVRFMYHRDTRRLLEKCAEYGVTCVLFGNVCGESRIRELLSDGYCEYVVEWFNKQYAFKRPVLCAHSVHVPAMNGAINVFRNITDPDNADTERVRECVRTWIQQRAPHTAWNEANHFRSAHDGRKMYDATAGNTAFHQYTQQQQQQQQQRHQQSPRDTDTMNMRRACAILDLRESETRCERSVKRAYRKMALIHHPDKVSTANTTTKTTTTNTSSTVDFAEIVEAYNYLLSIM